MSTDLPGGPLVSEGRTLIDDLLDEQQLLTPVAIFSRKHKRHAVPAQAKHYSDLIPLSSPAPGEQYAFAVQESRPTFRLSIFEVRQLFACGFDRSEIP